jgi:5-methylcytosine-specific restriction endonuclease McrA
MPCKTQEQQREYQRIRAANRRAKWLEENGPCEDCGGSEKLEVHHRDPKEKISHNVWSWSTSRMLEELAKCSVLCNTCHKKHSAKQRKDSAKLVHGTLNAYRIFKCRCKICISAYALKRKKWAGR